MTQENLRNRLTLPEPVPPERVQGRSSFSLQRCNEYETVQND
ncbi:hypothetical protein HMPREF9061_00842 [Actinomyces sp. oral taxon 181 str. F0379]|nr:hypothetical protein HMPREF9061_00842 [Actinomyces sp. oral taxon 181 str. F0379]